MSNTEPSTLRSRVRDHLAVLYGDAANDDLAATVCAAIGIGPSLTDHHGSIRFSASEAILISYGDTLRDGDRAPLAVLGDFVDEHLHDTFSTVHVLPFFPSSSDGGFSVVDYEEVAPELGSWADIERLAKRGGLMADLILNHGSAQSEWFNQFCNGELPGAGFFVTAEADTDVSRVTRPRTHPLLHGVDTARGMQHVWCTFSHDQVDFDFANPDVLLAFCRIIDLYLRRGVTRLRLDAVAYVWKDPATTSIHLPETHELVRLLHTLLAERSPETLLITETNVPHEENVSYFGDRNEAHVVYNFSLVPLVLHTVLRSDSTAFTAWASALAPTAPGTTYLNFLASHDGLGLRPAEGLLTDDDISALVQDGVDVGGRFSAYSVDGGERPYELNAALSDLLAGPSHEHVDRFIAAHAIMLAFVGIPAIYIHSLLATTGDMEAVARTGRNRAINRPHRQLADVLQQVRPGSAGPGGPAEIFERLVALVRLRSRQPAFSPAAEQVVLDVGPSVVAILRIADSGQHIYALQNVSDRSVDIALDRLPRLKTGRWEDLIDGPAARSAGLAGSVDELQLGPWQTRWISGHPQESQ